MQIMNTTQPIAHAAKDANGTWRDPHDLAEHLTSVAALAACHARSFGAEDWAHLAGMWHDLGKYRPRFQRYIRLASGFEADAHIKGEGYGKAPHSTAGAMLACDRFQVPGRVLAYLIAGHHAGLYDWFGGLDVRLDSTDSRDELNEALAQHPPANILDHGTFTPDLRTIPGGKAGFALWVRMLFSCLVDADFLDTEAYMDAGKAGQRGKWPTVQNLLEPFDRFMAEKATTAAPTPVNLLRADILRQCREKAQETPGLFSLTVPTGGGKTLSSMAFALEHAKKHNKRRIIYVIPYTSIIEQTADIFRGIFGDAVIEHHSNAEVEPGAENSKSRLASENWDAPIVVTTNVQFFESLFAAKTSRCRKLHNIVESIVVLDEAQLLPPEFLQPILDVLNLLKTHYGVTVVLSTATQPALTTREYFDVKNNMRGLDNVREIMSDPDLLYSQLERINVRLPDAWHTSVSWDVLASEISQRESVLAIVNRRKDARELWQRLPEGKLHLSALMCGEHRSQTIKQIKARLKDNIPIRVVSTQLVEAGVDVDFPVVYRALSGLDSIAQAAGRCNREGRLTEQGEVVVFVPPEGKLPEMIRNGINATISVLHHRPNRPLDRLFFKGYFERLYTACNLDQRQIVDELKMNGKLDCDLAVNFRTAADKFKLIQDEDSAPVIVRYRGVDDKDETIDILLNTLRKEGSERWLMRRLQRYTVTIHHREATKLHSQGDIEVIIPGLYAQVSDWLYDKNLGLLLDGQPPDAKACVA